MTDIATLVGRLLPFAVIASLAMIFYLLDVFSVRPAFDAEPAKVAARQISVVVPRRADTPSPQPSAAFPAPTVNPAQPANDVPAPPPSAAQFQPPREAPVAMPPPAESMEDQDNGESAAPRYIPPAGSPGQPLASDTNTMAPVQLPNDEIPQDQGEQIESETLQALDQDEQAASQAGASEQEQ
jgi:hypothetical protein